MVTSELPPRVVVTGAAGVLGSRLAARLRADGCLVTGIDLRPAAAAPGLSMVTGDIRDPELLAGVLPGADALVHCAAALPSYPAAEIRSVIVAGTGSVLAAARQARIPRVVHISSTAVYGLPRQVPTPEEHPRAPVDTYSAAKAAAEQVAERYRDGGGILSIIRPKTFLGPGRMGLFAMLFQWAEEGRNFPILGPGDVRIQMLGLDDLVLAVRTVLAAAPAVADDTYNIGAVDFGTLREDFQAVLDDAGHGRRVVSLPARPALAALRLLGRAGMSPVYGRLLSKLLADSYVSVEKARVRLGFRPSLSNQDAILATYRWWRSRPGTPTSRTGGRASHEPWRQGALRLAKIFF